MEDQVEQEYLHHRRRNTQRVAAPPSDGGARKVGLYDSEMVLPQGHYFWTGKLAYDKAINKSVIEAGKS